jgi:hypothetical protein
MAFVFSTNNRYFGLGNLPTPTFSQAWLHLKDFLKTPVLSGGPEWKVVQSGATNFTYDPSWNKVVTDSAFKQDDLGVDGDVFIDATGTVSSSSNTAGMSAGTVWFVLQDPVGKRELLFYRNIAVDDQYYAANGGIRFYGAELLRCASFMSIAYSPSAGFSETVGHDGLAVSAANPPVAEDMVWLNHLDNNPDDCDFITGEVKLPSSTPLKDTTSLWCGATEDDTTSTITPDVDGISSKDFWNLHICAAAPDGYRTEFPFYFCFTGEKTSYGFFALDTLKDESINSNDTDAAVIWYKPTLGGPNCKRSTNHVFGLNQSGLYLRSWAKKPASFSSRTDFATKIATNECRFVPTLVASLFCYAGVSNNAETNARMFSSVPAGYTPSIYDSKDHIFPVHYFKYANQHTGNIDSEQTVWNTPNFYKGVSELFKLESTNRFEFDTLHIDAVRDHIVLGCEREVVLPWDGSIVNQA